jgi:putative membrane-bound dehydrogenase-like protein
MDVALFLFRNIVALVLVASLLAQQTLISNAEAQDFPQKTAPAKSTFQIQSGLEIQVVAGDLLISDPVAIAFDENSDLFVAEMRGYPNHGNYGLGTIRHLRDTDGDGHIDNSAIFADKLNWPSAVACYKGGVFVAAAPDIIYLKDTTGNGKADWRKVVYSGFAKRDVHALVNSLRWGLDNRIHGVTNGLGSQLYSAVDRNAPALDLSGFDFAINPRNLAYSKTSGGGQHGLAFGEFGRKFVSTDSRPFQQVMIDQYYLGRNKHVLVKRATANTTNDQLLVQPQGTPPVNLTAAAGLTFYLGDQWPSKREIFVADPVNNLIHKRQVDSSHFPAKSTTIEGEAEFLTSSDKWFRPVDLVNGPDGALYVVDMRRESIDPNAQHIEEDPKSALPGGHNQGRIYRIVKAGTKVTKLPSLANASNKVLVETLGHANGWHRETAARLLVERNDYRTLPLLEDSLDSPASNVARIRAMYVMRSIGGSEWPTVSSLIRVLTDPDVELRRHAVQIAEPLSHRSKRLREAVHKLAGTERDPEVLLQVALTLGQWQGTSRNRAIATILNQNSNQPWMRLATMSSLRFGAGDVFALLAANDEFRKSGDGRKVLLLLATQISKQQQAEDLVAASLVLRRFAKFDRPFAVEVINVMAPEPQSMLHRIIDVATNQASGSKLEALIDEAKKTSGTRTRTTTDRVQAVHVLRLGSFSDVQTTLVECLDESNPIQIQLAALNVLAKFRSPEFVATVVSKWPSFGPLMRHEASDLIVSRHQWLPFLLNAVTTGRVRLQDFSKNRIAQFLSHDDQSVREVAKNLLEADATTGREDVVQQYQVALNLPGDATKGAAVFQKNCLACHRVGDPQQAIGPDLYTVRSRNLAAILKHTLDPNSEISPRFTIYSISTRNRRNYVGIIGNERGQNITLIRKGQEPLVMLRSEIESIKAANRSLMPANFDQAIGVDEMADLLAFLKEEFSSVANKRSREDVSTRLFETTEAR